MKLSLEGLSHTSRSFYSASLRGVVAVGIFMSLLCAELTAQTGTFIDRWAPTDLRVVSYNIYLDSIFADDADGAVQGPKFARVMQALQPDIIHLQEIYDHTATETRNLIDSILPLEGGAHWFVHKSFDNVTLSKYPLTMTATDTIPDAPSTSVAIAKVDLPDNRYDDDFYFMNNHFKCCGGVGSEEDEQRQHQADALVNWMRDARTPGGFINLPADTPMAVVGDLNIVGSQQPLDTVISGNIINEGIYGADSPPDWDGTSLTDLHPVHNGSGSLDYTWRNNSQLSRLDFILYTDSVLDVANSFILNTVSMTTVQRAAAGLQTNDVTISGNFYDHLPLVVDFRLDILGDYDRNDNVDEEDFELWRDNFGSTTFLQADGNGNDIVDAADYTVWRDNFGAGTPPEGAGFATAIPEPSSVFLSLISLGALLLKRRHRG